ncbi:HAD family hydrolase [Salinispira pacifica]|uniref:HAD family hydrolase n=1 Tax=Salinispira pacifica TaxID=1307761 RepID=V5WH13_9SPIO|nr:HAD-IA family hydrolase [Salinispira pacifica]AHC15068.1 hypothetical protein L21SP2_1685 [Salinispira pacifica]
MKIFSIPRTIDLICFDIDSTLYTHVEYAAHQYDVLYAALSRHLGQDVEELRQEIEAWRKQQAGGSEGNKPSLGTAFTRFGADISLSIRWRSEFIRPEDFLNEDIRLRKTLEILASPEHRSPPADAPRGRGTGNGVEFAAVTNNPTDIARRTLRRLGVDKYFSRIVGLDTAGESKPRSRHYDIALKSTDPANSLAVGDRYHVDIQPALERNMGAVLVDGVEDVYHLPEAIEEAWRRG